MSEYKYSDLPIEASGAQGYNTYINMTDNEDFRTKELKGREMAGPD